MSKQLYQIVKNKDSNISDIYLYGDIGESDWFTESVSAKDFIKQLGSVNSETINLHINSYGGSVTDGLAIYNNLKSHPAKVNVTIDGVAASIASIIAMAGDTISMAEGSLLMIHAPWTVIAGDSNDLREEAELLDKITRNMAGIYASKTGLSEDDLMNLLTDGKDHWFDVEEAIDLGLINEIEESNQVINFVQKGLIEKHPSILNKIEIPTKLEVKE